MPRRRCLLPSLVLLLCAVPPAAAQGLPVTSVDVLAREVLPGDVDGILEPGDTIELVQRLRGTGTGEVRSLSGRLSSDRSDVALLEPASPFPDLIGADAEAANTATPFRVRLPASPAMRCGAKAGFSIALRDGQDRTATVSHTITTGAPGTPVGFTTGTDVAIDDQGTIVESVIEVPEGTPGTTAAVRVLIERLTHAQVRDLRLTLVAPSGVEVPLVPEAPSVTGADLVGTWLQADGPAMAPGGAPWTGTFGAPGLEELGGETFAGSWRLRASTTVSTPGVTGLLHGWTVQLAPATCEPLVSARIDRQPSIGVPGGTVRLTSLSLPGPGASIDEIVWDLDDDGTYETADDEPTLAAPHPTSSGMRAVRLKVRDTLGREDTETLLIPFSNPPVGFVAAVAEQDTGTPLTFDASLSGDPDGDSIVEFRWDVDGEPGFERSTRSTPTLAWSFERPRIWPVAVEVRDGYGAKGVYTRNVTARNRPPAASLTAEAWVVLGEPFTLDATGSDDPDGEVRAWTWDLDDDGACDDRTTATGTTTHVLGASATVGVCVTDDSGGTSGRTARAIGVTRRPAAVITTASTVKPGAPLALSAAASSDPDGDPIDAWEWDLDGNGTYEQRGVTATASWPLEGTRTIGLRVTDSRRATGTTTAQVVVVNPSPLAALTVTPATAVAGTPVVLDARGSSDDAGIAGFAFDLDGDGTYESPSATGVASRAYPRAGTLSVGVRVIDAGGKTATRRATLTITAPPQPTSGGPPPAAGPAGGPSPLVAPVTATRAGTESTAGSPAAAGPGAGTATLAAALTGLGSQPLRAVLARGLALRCTAERAATCRLVATVSAATARRLRLARAPRREVVVGTATARNGALRLRLRRAAVRQLGAARSVLVTVRGTARDAAGRSTPIARAVRLRR